MVIIERRYGLVECSPFLPHLVLILLIRVHLLLLLSRVERCQTRISSDRREVGVLNDPRMAHVHLSFGLLRRDQVLLVENGRFTGSAALIRCQLDLTALDAVELLVLFDFDRSVGPHGPVDLRNAFRLLCYLVGLRQLRVALWAARDAH